MDVDKFSKEQRILKQKIEVLERENIALKKSLFELSTRYHSHKLNPFPLKDVLDAGIEEEITSLLDHPDPNQVDHDSNHTFVTVDAQRDYRQFYMKHDLKGHSGAIYAVQFSHCGKYIASGSFDKTVRVWELNSSNGPREIHCLKNHTLNISDLSWSQDSSVLLSGAYDQTCRTWDVESGKIIESYDSAGFVQCVMFNPSGTSRNILCVTDRRDPSQALSFRNDAMVNSLYSYPDGIHVISADSAGMVKTWDIRAGRPIQSFANEPTRKPLSHITCCPNTFVDSEPRYMAVNSYDNVIRIFDRISGSPTISSSTTTPKLLHSLKGYKNRNWPIKSAFFKAKEGTGGMVNMRGLSAEEMFAKPDTRPDSTSKSERLGDDVMLLATGSTDHCVYVYGAGKTEGSNELLQRLEGHMDRVYAVTFHPTEPILCSCSADFTMKLWYCNRKKT